MWAASPARKQVAITHRLGNEAAQWRNGFFDRRADDDTLGHVLRTPRPEFLPEAVVRPIFEPRFEIALNVVSAQHRFAHVLLLSRPRVCACVQRSGNGGVSDILPSHPAARRA